MAVTAGTKLENTILCANPDAGEFLKLGMMYSAGNHMPADRVAAHKWFNLAGMRGNSEAVRLRCELASEMSSAEIVAAQRAARDWLTRH